MQGNFNATPGMTGDLVTTTTARVEQEISDMTRRAVIVAAAPTAEMRRHTSQDRYLGGASQGLGQRTQMARTFSRPNQRSMSTLTTNQQRRRPRAQTNRAGE